MFISPVSGSRYYTRMEETLATSRRIAWLTLAASVVALLAAVCAIFVYAIH
jgi:hypothetical protein